MVTEDDLLSSLNSNGTAFAEVNNKYNKGLKPKKPNLWDKTDFDPLKIDPEEFKKTNKTFTVGYYKQGKDIDDETLEKFLKIAKVLTSRGYVYRYNGTADDKLRNSILSLDNMVSETYLAWKNINKNITTPTLSSPSETAYRLASSLHKSFSKLPPGVRAILASDVHAMLGRDCISPVDIFLCYSTCGSEKFAKDTDYKKLGYLSFYFGIARASAIPVFNLKREDSVSRIVSLLKALNITPVPASQNDSVTITDGMEQI